jgi:hypothetical protein
VNCEGSGCACRASCACTAWQCMWWHDLCACNAASLPPPLPPGHPACQAAYGHMPAHAAPTAAYKHVASCPRSRRYLPRLLDRDCPHHTCSCWSAGRTRVARRPARVHVPLPAASPLPSWLCGECQAAAS